jgi:uncharacterized coiled-coil protein SlyX
MKNISIGILLIATVVFGSLYVQQIRKTSQAEATIAGLRQNVIDRETELAQHEKQAARLRNRLEDSRAEVLTKATEAAELQQALTNRVQTDAETNSKPSNPLAAMFKDPAMREMIKTQQKTVLSTMIDKNYAKLFADLHLSPEQSAALKEMIMNKQLSGTDVGMSMFSDDVDATKRAELVQQAKATNDVFDAQIKTFLGDDNYTQFQAYEKTQTDRLAVSGFKDQLAGGSMALNPDQEQQLIQGMTQERQNFKFTTDFSDRTKLTGDFASYFSEDKVNQYFQEQDQLNQKYLANARGILSPDQFDAFQKYLVAQQGMQKMGMQMAAKMFAPKSGGK